MNKSVFIVTGNGSRYPFLLVKQTSKCFVLFSVQLFRYAEVNLKIRNIRSKEILPNNMTKPSNTLEKVKNFVSRELGC